MRESVILPLHEHSLVDSSGLFIAEKNWPETHDSAQSPRPRLFNLLVGSHACIKISKRSSDFVCLYGSSDDSSALGGYLGSHEQ